MATTSFTVVGVVANETWHSWGMNEVEAVNILIIQLLWHFLVQCRYNLCNLICRCSLIGNTFSLAVTKGTTASVSYGSSAAP